MPVHLSKLTARLSQLIFSDEYLKAADNCFHVDHFLCRNCDKSLANQSYVLQSDKQFCIECYEQSYANVCEACKQSIGVHARDLCHKDKHWHDACFACFKCRAPLIDKPFGAKLDKVYCAACYDSSFASRCDACKQPFRAGKLAPVLLRSPSSIVAQCLIDGQFVNQPNN